MSQSIVNTYEETCQVVQQLGILPLSGFIPDHPSLDTITKDTAWHTGAATDPWLWRDRFAAEGVAAYGRFFGPRPLLISREIFPLIKCLLSPSKTIEESYTAGLLARSTLHVYDLIQEHDGIDVRELRKLAGMQHKSDKTEFDHALIDLQNAAAIVISGVSERLNDQGNKSGWNSTCYMLSERWMAEHDIKPLSLAPAEAKAQLFQHLKPRWEERALAFLEKKLAR